MRQRTQQARQQLHVPEVKISSDQRGTQQKCASTSAPVHLSQVRGGQTEDLLIGQVTSHICFGYIIIIIILYFR